MVCLEVYRRPDKSCGGLDRESTVGVARQLPSLTLEIAYNFRCKCWSIIMQ